MTHFQKISFHGDNNIGLYGFATDSYCITGLRNKDVNKKIKEVLGVKVYNFEFLGTELTKLFAAGNSSGFVVSSIIPSYEVKELKEAFNEKIKILKINNALGNFILMNDKGIVISPEIRKHQEEIEKFFSLDSKVCTIAKLNLVGSLGIANNKGCLLHPDVSDREAEIISDALNVEVNIGTISFGNPYVGSGIIVNSKGYLVSKNTSGPELGRVTETLGFLE